jgi:hypothetical protein
VFSTWIKNERNTMLRQQKHYSEGIQSSSGVTSRNQTKVNVYIFRIIYIMLTNTFVLKVI